MKSKFKPRCINLEAVLEAKRLSLLNDKVEVKDNIETVKENVIEELKIVPVKVIPQKQKELSLYKSFDEQNAINKTLKEESEALQKEKEAFANVSKDLFKEYFNNNKTKPILGYLDAVIINEVKEELYQGPRPAHEMFD